jgi:hypothetical protein
LQLPNHLLDLIPEWAFFLLSCLIAIFSVEIGFRMGKKHRNIAVPGSDSSVGVVVGSILALLAFLLAFTFNMAASRYEDRRQVILTEANAIGTTYLRAHLLITLQRPEIEKLLREYITLHLEIAKSSKNKEEMIKIINESEKIQAQIWEKAVIEANQNPSIITSLFIQSLNDLIDIHSKRLLVGGQNNIPLLIWVGLFSVAIIGLSSTGYQSGLDGIRKLFITIGLALVFAIVLTLIADLDHPRKGWFRTTQLPILRLEKMILEK